MGNAAMLRWGWGIGARGKGHGKEIQDSKFKIGNHSKHPATRNRYREVFLLTSDI
jgi:hypothetical protein